MMTNKAQLTFEKLNEHNFKIVEKDGAWFLGGLREKKKKLQLHQMGLIMRNIKQ